MRKNLLIGTLILGTGILATSSVMAATPTTLDTNTTTFTVTINPEGRGHQGLPTAVMMQGSCTAYRGAIMLPPKSWNTGGSQPPTQKITTHVAPYNYMGCNVLLVFPDNTKVDCGLFPNKDTQTIHYTISGAAAAIKPMQIPANCSITAR